MEIILEGKKPPSSLSLFSLPSNSVIQFSLVQTSSQPEITGEKEKRKVLAKLIGFEGSYLRFEGEAIIEKIENNQVIERIVEDSAVWELMYFGKACADKRYKEK